MLWLIQVDLFIIHDLVAEGSPRSSVTLAEITIQMYILAYDLIRNLRFKTSSVEISVNLLYQIWLPFDLIF